MCCVRRAAPLRRITLRSSRILSLVKYCSLPKEERRKGRGLAENAYEQAVRITTICCKTEAESHACYVLSYPSLDSSS